MIAPVPPTETTATLERAFTTAFDHVPAIGPVAVSASIGVGYATCGADIRAAFRNANEHIKLTKSVRRVARGQATERANHAWQSPKIQSNEFEPGPSRY